MLFLRSDSVHNNSNDLTVSIRVEMYSDRPKMNLKPSAGTFSQCRHGFTRHYARGTNKSERVHRGCWDVTVSCAEEFVEKFKSVPFVYVSTVFVFWDVYIEQ